MAFHPGLLASYCRTSYWVAAPAAYARLRVGETDEGSTKVFTENGVEKWAFLTAVNPLSKLLSQAENRQRLTALLNDLGDAAHWAAWGVGDAGVWPPEESLFVFNMEPEQALALAEKYEQHAVLVGQTGEAPRLLAPDREGVKETLEAALDETDPIIRWAAGEALKRL